MKTTLTHSLATRKRQLLTAGMGLGLAVALAACSGAAESNAFVDPLNSAATQLQAIGTSGAGGAQALETAINTNLPKMKTDLAAMQAAAAGLSSELQPIAATCNAQMESLINSLQSIATSLSSADARATLAAAKHLQTVSSDFDSKCVQPYNAANGK
jgi:hypothetical protein